MNTAKFIVEHFSIFIILSIIYLILIPISVFLSFFLVGIPIILFIIINIIISFIFTIKGKNMGILDKFVHFFSCLLSPPLTLLSVVYGNEL